MNWFFNNPLGNLYGPTFLLLYGLMVAGSLVAIRWFLRRADSSISDPPMEIPEVVDPLQIAYLRGGEAEVIRTVMVDLVERELIVESPKPTGVRGLLQSKTPKWISATQAEVPTQLTEVHEVLLSQFQSPKTAVSALESSVQSLVKQFTSTWRDWMESERLVISTEALVNTAMAFWISLLGLEALGTYKIIAALQNGHHNIVILIGMMIVTPFVLIMAMKPRRLSCRGQIYLSHLQAAFSNYSTLKNFSHETDASVSRVRAEPSRFSSELSYSAPLFAAGLFGVGALEGSSFDPIYQSYRKAATNVSGCSSGSSCGSGGCSGGSSCGGGGCGGGCGGCGS